MAKPGGMTMDGLATTPASRTRGFASARRHSRFVKFAKLAIPLGSLLAVALVVFYAYIDPFRNIPGLTIGKIGVSGTQVTMESPKLNGFRNNSRPYEVTASAATQDILKPNFVELKDLRARIVTDDKGGAARLEAAFGVLNTEKEQMNLRQDVQGAHGCGPGGQASVRLHRFQGRDRDVGRTRQRDARKRRHRRDGPRRHR